MTLSYCNEIIDEQFIHINIFSFMSSVILLLICLWYSPRRICKKFGRSFRSKMGRGADSNSSVIEAPEEAQNLLNYNTRKLLHLLATWNIIWIIFQCVVAFELSIWIQTPVKAVIWGISIYLETFVTLFVFVPIGRTNWLKYNYYVSLISSILITILFVFFSIQYSAQEYYLFDIVFSATRILLVMILNLFPPQNYFASNNNNSGADNTNNTSNLEDKNKFITRFWSIFMILTYSLNTIQESLHYYKEELYACFKIPTKIIYFLFLVPITAFVVEKTNDLWTQTYTEQFEKIAADWINQLNSTLHEDNSGPKIGKRLGSVLYSPMSNFIIDKNQLLIFDGRSNDDDKDDHGHNQDQESKHANKNALGNVNSNNKIGQGSNGSVHLYFYKKIQANVAVKFVKITQLLENDGILKFKREFAHLVQVQNCPQLIKFHGVFFDIKQDAVNVGLVLEYAEYGSLFDNLPFEIYETKMNQQKQKENQSSSSNQNLKQDSKLEEECELSVSISISNMEDEKKSFSSLISTKKVMKNSISISIYPSRTQTKITSIGVDQKQNYRNNFFKYTWSFAIDCARGLSYLHDKNDFIFLDLKPENFVICKDYKGKLIDLGSIIKSSKSGFFECCCFGDRINHDLLAWTEAYTAPEALEMKPGDSDRVIDKSCDVWSFGFFLWHCITGIKIPFVLIDHGDTKQIKFIENRFDVLAYYKDQNLRPPIPKNCPIELMTLLNTCWHINPQERMTLHQVLSELLRISKIFDTDKFFPEFEHLEYIKFMRSSYPNF